MVYIKVKRQKLTSQQKKARNKRKVENCLYLHIVNNTFCQSVLCHKPINPVWPW